MKREHFYFTSSDNTKIFVNKFLTDNNNIKGVVIIVHGMAEHSERYVDFAEFLTSNGFVVYADDHRGHGKTAKTEKEYGFLGESNGWRLMVEDELGIIKKAKDEYPDNKLFILGHSMGSFITQNLMIDNSDIIDGVILSGSNGAQGFLLDIALLIAKIEILTGGLHKRSKILDKLTFGNFNRGIKKPETKFDWLTRDKEVVMKYIEDPKCGGIFTAEFFYDFFKGLKYIENKSNLNKIKKELPIFIVSGKDDPVGNFGKGVKKLYNSYKNLGFKNIQLKLYPEARHEILNELNKKEVYMDILNFLEKLI